MLVNKLARSQCGITLLKNIKNRIIFVYYKVSLTFVNINAIIRSFYVSYLIVMLKYLENRFDWSIAGLTFKLAIIGEIHGKNLPFLDSTQIVMVINNMWSNLNVQ